MESYNIWPFVSGFFHLTQCFQSSYTLWQVPVLHSSLWKNNIPLYGCTIFVYPFITWEAFWLFLPLGCWGLGNMFLEPLSPWRHFWFTARKTVLSLIQINFICLDLAWTNFWQFETIHLMLSKWKFHTTEYLSLIFGGC